MDELEQQRLVLAGQVLQGLKLKSQILTENAILAGHLEYWMMFFMSD